MSKANHKKPIICAIMKLEQDYILEWVAYHRLQGFDLMIADNCSAGPQTALLKSLEQQGLIHYFDYRHVTVSPQMPAYKAMYWTCLKMGYKYLGFLDADEFLEAENVPLENTANYVVSILKKTRFFGIKAPWRLFGSAGQTHQTADLVIARFQKSAKDYSDYVKCFMTIRAALPKALVKPKRFIKSPHTLPIWHYLVCSYGQKISSTGETCRLFVRHYAVKSREEFEFKNAFREDAIFYKLERGAAYFQKNDQNDINSPIDPAFVDKVRQKMKNWSG